MFSVVRGIEVDGSIYSQVVVESFDTLEGAQGYVEDFTQVAEAAIDQDVIEATYESSIGQDVIEWLTIVG